MPLMCGNQLRCCRPVLHATWPAVIGNVVGVDDGVSFHYRPVNIGCVNKVFIHVHDRSVVGKLVTTPLSAGETDAPIAEAVVDAAVIADMASPVALVEAVAPTVPAPIIGCPQSTDEWHRDPGARDPVVSAIAIGPIARRPHQVRLGARGLLINRQLRRRKTHIDADPNTQLGMHRHGDKREQQRKH